MKPEELLEQKDILIVDIREPEELQFGVIKGSIHVPMIELQKHIKEWVGKKVLFYCHTGGRSSYITKVMRSFGVDSYNLEGGIMAYRSIDPSIKEY